MTALVVGRSVCACVQTRKEAAPQAQGRADLEAILDKRGATEVFHEKVSGGRKGGRHNM